MEEITVISSNGGISGKYFCYLKSSRFYIKFATEKEQRAISVQRNDIIHRKLSSNEFTVTINLYGTNSCLMSANYRLYICTFKKVLVKRIM